MHGSSSDWSFRRAGIICSKTGEKLGTIEEEHFGRTPPGTRKSHTFHALRELCEQPSGFSNQGYDQTKPPNRRSRKRSLFFEMGERIRLFSTGSFVTTSVQATVPKAKSLNSLLQSSTVVNQSRRGFQRVAPSGSSSSLKFREIDHLEVELNRAPSQLGLLCRHCSTSDVCCPKAQQEMSSPSLPSLYSLAPSDLSTNEPICRICHCCWPADPSDPLISPCRCSGSLQYVHASCLMHWLDISSRKLHRPAICELCLYKYRRRRTFKYRDMKMPECSDRDVRYYTLFMCALVLMVFSAVATVVCFQMEKQATASNQTSQFGQPGATTTEATSLEPESGERIPKDIDNLLSTITLVSAIVFFFSFFLSMYAHVKSGLSFCNYLVLCWSSNLEWSIEEYKQSRDSQYLNKLEELRRKINEKAKKAADEVEPLRSSIIVIE